MSEVAAGIFELPDFRGINDSNLEETVKTLLLWSRIEWSNSEHRNSKLHKLINSLRYWKNKLKPAVKKNNIIVTLFNESKNVKPEIIKMVYAIEKAAPGVQVSGFSEFRNPKYLCFYFDSEADRDLVLANLKYYDDSYVVFLSWALEDALSILKVHWLPWAIDLEIIKKEVEKYAYIVNEQRETLTMLSGRVLPAGKLTFKVKMKDTISVEAVPHLTTIADMEALITIQGRSPLCINCGELGHIAKKCRSKYCHGCRKFALKTHVCVQATALSYADATKGAPAVDPDLVVSDEEEETSENMSEVVPSTGPDLARQIELLQSQLKAHEDPAITLIRLQKKRKNQALISNVDLNDSLVDAVTILPLPMEATQVGDKEEVAVDPSLIVHHDVLSFDGPSSLNQSPQNRKTYGRSGGRVGVGGAKASKLFDSSLDREFVFDD